jgi:hypothetical protein
MTPITDKRVPKLRKAPQPPLSHPGGIPDSDRAKKPLLGAPLNTQQELNPGDRVEGLGNFGKPSGEVGTVERTMRTRWSNGMMTVARDSLNLRCKKSREPRS